MARGFGSLVKEVEATALQRSSILRAYRECLSGYDELGVHGLSSLDQIRRAADEIDCMANPFLRTIGLVNEQRVCAAFDALLSLGSDSLGALDGGEVVSIHREYLFPCGRVDRLLKHSDGSITLVEIKKMGSRRDIAQAIGQVIMYGAAAKRLLDATDFHLAICVSGGRDEWIEAACEYAGVTYLNISNQLHALVDAAARGYSSGGSQ